MKKILITTLLALMVALLVAGPASAQKGQIYIKGEVKAMDGGTMTVESNKGDTFVITIPEEIDVSAIQAGDSVLVKATAAEDSSWVAVSIKKVGQGSGDGDTEVEKPEGFQDNSAFCAEDKQDKPHPLAPKLAERFGVSEEWVMEKFCDGYSIGAIMLAIKTSQIEGMTATPDELLASRTAGKGWGLIWQELGLIGSEKNGQSPPGLLKKPDHAGPKNK
jgi:hypothetical protein